MVEAGVTSQNVDKFMTCVRYHCRMRKIVCVARQLKADKARELAGRMRYAKFPTDAEVRYSICYECPQGLEIAREMGIVRVPAQVKRTRRRPKSQRSEIRGQKSEGRGQRSENKERKLTNRYSKGEVFPELAGKIRGFREKRSWTQERLADFCGLNQSVISRAELGKPIARETAGTIEEAIKQRTDDK